MYYFKIAGRKRKEPQYGSYIWDKRRRTFVPKAEYQAANNIKNRGDGLQVVSDIEPYRSVIDGTVITSRRWHRQHLKNNGCVEVGNEGMKDMSHNRPKLDSPAQDLARNLEKAGL